MDDDHARSSRRHHILGSINPDSERRRTRSRSRSRSRSKSPDRRRRRRDDDDDADEARKRPPAGAATAAEAEEDPEPAEDAAPPPRAKRLRLKDESSRRHRTRHRSSRAHSRSRSRSPSSRRRRQRHGHGRRRSPNRPDPHEAPPIDADAAFRESLFDAMADDEGAAYWQGVYGQPIHQYGGELENMNEDQYAAHVRRRMWERTREGMLEAAELEEAERVREARRRRRRQRAETEAAAAAAAAEPAGPRGGRDGARLSREVGESLARGRERQRRRDAQRAWDEYAGAWEGAAGPEVVIVVWPGPGGRDGISEDALRGFYYGGLEAGGEDDEAARVELVARLRGERLRWHPDKMQQRLGGRVDQDAMRDITAVFQIVDRLWGEVRPRQK